jgi:hypothetical protein
LSQADSTVVRGHSAVGPDLDAGAREQVLHVLEQQFVLENPAGQDDRIDRMGLAQDDGRVAQTLRDGALKGSRALGGIAASVVSERVQ